MQILYLVPLCTRQSKGSIQSSQFSCSTVDKDGLVDTFKRITLATCFRCGILDTFLYETL